MVIGVAVAAFLYVTFSIPTGGETYGNGAYRAVHTGSTFNGLCGEYTIVDTQKNKKIAKINLCEDNIKSIEKVGDNLEIVSDRKNPFYIKNLVTGEVVNLVK